MALVARFILQTRKKPYGTHATLVGVYPPPRKSSAKVALVAYHDKSSEGSGYLTGIPYTLLRHIYIRRLGAKMP